KALRCQVPDAVITVLQERFSPGTGVSAEAN
ncbi:MAG TPA: DUF448 domain-containing protein, partial [Synechococcus sp. UBA9887]|nr:DUF448 domain-containing protein [Synechococcus sp. UBA9887]